MNEAWMWYVAGERRKELLREVADDRLVREARHPGSHPASDWDGATSGGVAGRVVDLVWLGPRRWSSGDPCPATGGATGRGRDRSAVAPMSIARKWRGATRAVDAEAYSIYLNATGVQQLRSTPGNERVLVLRRIDGDTAEFEVISLWRDVAAIRAFAGDQPNAARYFPEDERYLLGMDPTVTHYEVAVDASGAAPRKAIGNPR